MSLVLDVDCWKLFHAVIFVPCVKCRSCIHATTIVTSMQLLHFTRGTNVLAQNSFQSTSIHFH